MKGVVSILWAAACLVASSAAPAAEIDERLLEQEQSTLALPPLQRVEGLVRTYDAWMPAATSTDCRSLHTEKLEPGFRATAHLAKYIADDTWLARLHCFRDALEANGLASSAHHDEVIGALVAGRRFSEANALIARRGASRHPLPVIVGDVRDQQGILELVAGGQVHWRPWYYRSGWEVVAFVHPHCGYSKRALARIADDPAWSWLRAHLRLIVQREPAWPEEGVRQWNAANPRLPMYLQAGAAGWTHLDSYETPVFHLLHDGRMEATVVGWRDDGEPLRALLQERVAEGGRRR